VAAVAQELRDRDGALRQLKYNLQRAQEQMKHYADKKQKDVQFAVGESVFLKLRPRRQQSVVQRIHQKLAPRFFGPAASKNQPIFHVSHLKKAIGDYQITAELPVDWEGDKG